MWCVELNAGDSVKVGDVTFTLKEKTGKRARVVIANQTGAPAIVIARATDKEEAAKKPAPPLEPSEQIG